MLSPHHHALRRWIACVSLLTGALLMATIGCRRGTVKRVIPGVSSGAFSELTESTLASILVCADSLGRTDRNIDENRCAPCVPIAVMTDAIRSVSHARDLWDRRARAPYDSLTLGASCIDLSWKFARRLRPHDNAVRVEYTLFKLSSAHAQVRDSALTTFDGLLDSLRTAGQSDAVYALRGQFATDIWRRAQRLLERPLAVARHPFEDAIRRNSASPDGWRALAELPSLSDTPGASEAQWAARLLDQTAQAAPTPALRSRWHRLALAPWVTLADWRRVDSAATALLARAPGDSAVLPALALARYRQRHDAVRDSPARMAQFDSALRAMPRTDSLRYDTFDGVLTAADDSWRYGFLPTDRMMIDTRGWSVIDPLWSTPVNELRLERRARVAEADYRYADESSFGEAGSETGAGQLLLRLGAPDARWADAELSDGRLILTRGWPQLKQSLFLEGSDASWMMFSHPRFSAQSLARMPLSVSGPTPPRARRNGRPDTPGLPTECTELSILPTVLACALARSSQWDGVPFYGTTETIDVTAARFRSGRDSVHLYLGAAVPTRAFKTADRLDATAKDRVILSAWLADPLGTVLFHVDDPRPLPTSSSGYLTAQWTPRIAIGSVMHRVEALEPSRPTGARGAALLTSDAQVVFPLRGFGMSDVLVAASTISTRQSHKRWTDIGLTPNGGAVEPRGTFSLTWEVYDLQPAPDGRVRWSVEIRRESGDAVTRGDMRGVLANSRSAGTRVIADEADAPAVAYTRDAPASAVVVDHLSTFNLGDAQPGRHVVQVRSRDLVSGKTVARGVAVKVRAKS